MVFLKCEFPSMRMRKLTLTSTVHLWCSEARKSSNRPPLQKVLDNLVYNYSPTYCGKAGYVQNALLTGLLIGFRIYLPPFFFPFLIFIIWTRIRISIAGGDTTKSTFSHDRLCEPCKDFHLNMENLRWITELYKKTFIFKDITTRLGHI